jgi:LacI family gluconate utilization system Gnt-I transcriptional repressor
VGTIPSAKEWYRSHHPFTRVKYKNRVLWLYGWGVRTLTYGGSPHLVKLVTKNHLFMRVLVIVLKFGNRFFVGFIVVGIVGIFLRSNLMANSSPKTNQNHSTVTIHHVARVAGVGRMTVSRAFNSPEKLAASTLKKVMDAVVLTGYVPNMTAGSLRSSRTRLIAAFVPTLSGLFGQMIQSLTNTAAENGYQVMLGQVGYSATKEADFIRAVIGRRPDGIVLTGTSHAPEVRRLLINSKIPVVETWEMTSSPIDMLVGFEHEENSIKVCEFLAAKKNKRIALVSGDDPRALRRNDAFVRVAHSLGLLAPVVITMPAPTNHASGRVALTALLEKDRRIDTVYCSSDHLAMGVLTEAHARGISVPKQLSVIGAGDLDFAASLSPSLTTVRFDGPLVGKLAVEFIVDRVEGREPSDKMVKLGCSIIEREST